ARRLRRRGPAGEVEAARAATAHLPTPDGLEEFVPLPLRSALASGVEPEHRQVTAAFVKFSGSDGVIETEGPDALRERLDALGRVTGDAAAEFGLTWLESDIDLDGGKLYLTAGAPPAPGR